MEEKGANEEDHWACADDLSISFRADRSLWRILLFGLAGVFCLDQSGASTGLAGAKISRDRGHVEVEFG